MYFCICLSSIPYKLSPLCDNSEEGCKVIIVGPHAAGMKYTGKYSYPVVSNKCIDDVKVFPRLFKTLYLVSFFFVLFSSFFRLLYFSSTSLTIYRKYC